MVHQRIQLGKKGEGLVADYLKKQGYVIKAMNYSQRLGEIDIIAQKNEIMAFVEVKTRNNFYFNVSEVIVPAKQRKIIQTARHYIAENNIYDVVIRFDAALLEMRSDDIAITYIPNAFTQESGF